MSAPATSLRDELAELVGPGRVAADPAELAARSRDASPGLAMRERAGEQLPLPSAVVWPTTTEEVSAVWRWATARGVPVVTYGGGGGVVGGTAGVEGAVLLDTKLLDAIGPLDDVSGLVVVGPGVVGQRLEEWLAVRRHTLGHFPSSITVSTVGGFAAARSAGQASTRYGNFSQMVAGLEAVLPDGTVIRRDAHPASAAGPDLIGLLLGSEGALGTLTELTLRVHPAPEAMVFRAFRVPDLPTGLRVLRAVLRTGLRPAVVRCYDEADTVLTHPDLGGCLLVTVTEGWPALAALESAALREVVEAQGGDDLGEELARHWHAHRYDVSWKLADYLKPGGSLGEAVALDTIEVAARWSRLDGVYAAVREALVGAVDLALCHASHAYPDGACLYFTFGAAGHGDEAAVRVRYEAAWAAAMEAAIAAGATITHHHGIGRRRAPWLAAELGDGGWELLRRIKAAIDPAGVANPGVLGL